MSIKSSRYNIEQNNNIIDTRARFHRDYLNEHSEVDAIISGGRFSTAQLSWGKKSSCNNQVYIAAAQN